MKIEILKDHLENTSLITSRVSNKNLSLPVLGCVVITAAGGRVTFQATNLDVSVELQVKAKIIEEGAVAVPAQTFNQLISNAVDQKILLEKKGDVLECVSGKGVSKIKTQDISEFPTLPFVKKGDGFSLTIPAKEFITTLKTVSFASSQSGMRPELSSVFLKISDGVITTAATDSFRLAEMKVQIKSKENIDPILIPSRNTQEIIRVVGTAEVVELRVGENQISIIADGNYITSRVIDGAFPDYSAIVPKTFSATATALTSEVVKILKKVSVFTDATGQVEVHISEKQKTVSFKAANTSVGETREEAEAVIEGDEVPLSFNVRYLLDALGVVSADSISLKFSGAGKPLIISETPSRGFMYLVMPMNK
ncbi:MAG: DNA polymerase III subunit beta [Patescibacteria group bacterium]